MALACPRSRGGTRSLKRKLINARCRVCADAGGVTVGLTGHTPAEIYELARATIRRNTTIFELIERFIPILQLFDLDHHLPAGALLPVAVAVQAGSKVMPEHRAWVNAHRDLDPSEFWV